MKNLMVILVLLVVVLAPIAIAKNAVSPGKQTAPGKMKKAQVKGNVDEIPLGVEKPVTLPVEDPEDEAEDASPGKGKGNGKDNQGQLASTAQQVRREQFQELKGELKAMGYHGPMNEFAIAFNRQINLLKDDVKGKANNTNDTNFTRAMVRETAERELARIREELMAGINVTDDNVTEIIDEENGNQTQSQNMVRAMNGRFKKMLFGVAKHGADAEQLQLRTQLQQYFANQGDVKQAKVSNKVAKQNLQYNQLRKQLKAGASLEDILTGLSG